MHSDKPNRDIPFLITFSYLTAFLLIRVAVFIAGSADTEFARAAGMGGTPGDRFAIGRNIILFGYHIHHFYIGILLVCFAGWISITGSRLISRRLTAVVYGAGLGLFMDEVGLLLTWGDYYSGLSYLLSLLLGGLFLSIVFFQPFWKELRRSLQAKGATSLVWRTFSRRTGILRLVDWTGDRLGRTESTSLVFTGALSLAVSVVIVFNPFFLRACVFAVFVVQGLTHLVRAVDSERKPL
jgi:hypothetical protein